MPCSCVSGAPAGSVAFTIDGKQYHIAPGTYTIPTLLTSIVAPIPNILSSVITGFKNINTNVVNNGPGATQTINGGESLASQYRQDY